MAGLAVVHLFSGKLRFLEGIPRSIWLSMAGGISVAYVFVHLLPELAEEQEAIREAPQERKTRFWVFALGAVAYAVVLLIAF